MPFALLDDKFHSNPKIRALGLDGAGLYALALSYCGSYTTDGFVPRDWALGAAGGRWGLLNRLAEHGAWDEVDEKDAAELADRSGNVIHFVAKEKGYIIPDFLQFNPSSVELEEKRAKRVSAGRKGAIKRWGDSTSHSKSDSSSHAATDSKRHSKTMAPRARAGAHPVPNPGSEPQEQKDLSLTAERVEHATNGLPFGKEKLTLELLNWIAGDADDGTPQVVRSYAHALPEGAIAKVLESARTAKPKNRARYAVAALRDEVGALT